VITVSGLEKSYGEVHAVESLSFAVEAGQILALLGPNGAGKTTTVSMLATLTTIDGGTATIGGFDVAAQPEQVRRLIGLAGQSAAIDEKLTARENLDLFCRLYKLPAKERRKKVEQLIEQFDMSEFADRIVETYSGGQRRRLDVVAALVADPPALFLDEPTTGLDPRSRSELWAAIGDLASNGTAIVLTTQYLEEADRLADEILIIDRGTTIASGTPETLKRGLERDLLEITVGADDLDSVVSLLGDVEDVATDVDAHRVSVPIGQNAARGIELLRRVEDSGVSIVDFQLRRPTLDDVFLSLTGAPTRTKETAS
jgi:ABC-2 type transport system ATP-binding protein